MKKIRKKYEKPKRLWDKERIEREKTLLKNYGLKKKREIWRAEALLRKYRRLGRMLAAKKDKEQEKMLIKKLSELGMVEENAGLDNVLALTIENILDRRLQTIVYKKGLTNSINQARQLIVHGKIAIEGRKIPYPGYLVPKKEEEKIQVVQKVK